MILLEDSRQQANRHGIKHREWLKNGISWNRCTLTCGDYQLPNKSDVAVDTKFAITELENDIMFHAKSKKDIETAIRDIYIKTPVLSGRPSEIFRLIVDDDSERFPEKEISDYCYANGIDETAMKKFQELYVKRHGFFHRGLIRAKNYGVKLFILVDNNDGVTDIHSLFK